jgi:ACT domain-containing protein
MEASFINYIEHCGKEGLFPNIVGFCVFCGIHRDTFYGYQEYEGYSDTIKSIDEMLEERSIQRLLGAKNPIGAIFYMKNKFGYADKVENVSTINHNYNLSLNVSQINDKLEAAKAELARLSDDCTPD